jgi:hypothetical protein
MFRQYRLFLLIVAVMCFSSATARPPDRATRPPLQPRVHSLYNDAGSLAGRTTGPTPASAAADTFVLAEFTFDGTSGPDDQGWVSKERFQWTVMDTFFHVADATELNGGDAGGLIVLEGAQSLWCGASPSGNEEICRYATLPGYGNNWSQSFTSVGFPRTGDVTLSYLTIWDIEPAEDYARVYYLDKDGAWQEITFYSWSLPGPPVKTESWVIPDSVLGDSVQIWFEFDSDGAWSDEDGYWPTDGAIIIDSVTVADTSGVIDFQDFESELLGARATNDGHWQAGVPETIGNFSGLFSGVAVLQEDGCTGNATALWGFFAGSTYDYSCGGHPEQAAVPRNDAQSYYDTDYLSNEIWSPRIDWNQDENGVSVPATAETAILEFDVYRDLPLQNLVLYQWFVRNVIDGCPQNWMSSNYIYYGDAKDWYRHRESIARHVDPAVQQIQVALRAVDMCWSWCGIYGDGSCHSHAPLFDNVRVVRVDVAGPSWEYFPFEMFADNFASDGTLTGTVRIDIASLRADGVPRDSATVTVTSAVGIDDHIPGDQNSQRAVYCHIKDVSPAKSGNVVSGDITLYPLVSSGDGWTTLRCYGPTGPRFRIDLNDALYTPGDTVWYYFSARDKNGVTNYWSLQAGARSSESGVRAHPMEVTCLPANAVNGTTDILYVDGFDGYGAQPFFETAFELLGITPDRFDVADPTYISGGGPGARVANVLGQIAPAYQKIVWNTGHLRRGGIHDGLAYGAWPISSDDFGMLFEFLDQSPNRPGVYFSGDNFATWWTTQAGAGAVNLRGTYVNFNVVADAHTAVGEPVSPRVIALPGSFFDQQSVGPDTLIAFGGGCSGVNDFDVLEATGSAGLQMAYSGNPSHGAVVTQITQNSVGDTARVVLSGFSFHYIRNHRSGLPPARAVHLASILRWLENDIDDPVGAGPLSPRTNSLSQNYPNPFNPTTTIRYSIERPAYVSLRIYNVTGQLVKTLVDRVQSPGEVKPLTWDGMNDSGQRVSSGVYFYRMVTENFTRTRKMVLLK